MILSVPIATDVIMNGHYLGTVSKDGQKELILKGGKGSLGNLSLKDLSKDGNFDDIPNEIGKGELKDIKLIFKLQADVIFLGYPNAGKSSLLNELTNSDVKTANYAFTTLEPQLGMMDDIVLMDLPGLIEGAHEGKGLGTKFVKHTESSKLLVHMVSLDNDDPWKIYQGLRQEIKDIDPKLAAKPELVVLTKSDEASAEKIKNTVKEFAKHKIKTFAVSIIDDLAIGVLKKAIKDSLQK
jgi:GTP-binding protein